MKLILNPFPTWTQRHIEFIKKYGHSYGVYFSEDQIEEELANIRNGNPSLRYSPSRCFEIFDDGKLYVGDLVITDINEDTSELSIMIFDEFSGNGYAFKAIQLFIEECTDGLLYLEAVVRGENREKGKIQNILERLSFRRERTENDERVNETWRINLKA